MPIPITYLTPPLVVKTSGTDDVILGYTYNEASALAGGIWNIEGTDPNTAEISKDLSVKDSPGGTETFSLSAATGNLTIGGTGEFPSVKTDFISSLGGGNIGVLSNVDMNANELINSGRITTGAWNGTYDTWIQGGVSGATLGARNLALLGNKATDTLYLNYNNEYSGGTHIGGNIKDFGGQTIRDAGGGWVRTYGNTGWYNGTYAGGMYMQDTTYVRTYNGKSLYAGTGGTAPSVYGINSGGNYGVFGQSAGTYGIYGKSTNAGYGGVIGYTANGSIYGILAHANAWSFYGNSNTYTSGYVRGDQGFRVGGTIAVSNAGVVRGGVPACTGATQALR